jgi:hypothetical protein
MQMQFKVTYSDGRILDSTAKPKDFVAFERQYGTTLAGLDENSTPLEHIYYLAWSPLHRAGIEPGAFDEFLDRIEEVSVGGETAAVDPTPPAASAEPLPDSPHEAA